MWVLLLVCPVCSWLTLLCLLSACECQLLSVHCLLISIALLLCLCITECEHHLLQVVCLCWPFSLCLSGCEFHLFKLCCLLISLSLCLCLTACESPSSSYVPFSWPLSPFTSLWVLPLFFFFASWLSSISAYQLVSGVLASCLLTSLTLCLCLPGCECTPYSSLSCLLSST